jgi:hypothetical protein
MAMQVEVANKDKPVEFFAPAERLLFRKSTSAHPFVGVFLSRYDFGQRPAHALTPQHAFTQRFGARRTFYLKISTITAGHLAMQVMSVRSADSNALVPASEIEFEFCGTAIDAVTPIWPSVQKSLSWPPTHTMSHQDIEDWTIHVGQSVQ